MPKNRVLAETAVGGVMGLAALAGRYAAGVARADRSWPAQVEAGLGDIGAVDEVSIVPLVERLTGEGSGLRGEPACLTWSGRVAGGCCSTPACPAANRNRRWRITPGCWACRSAT